SYGLVPWEKRSDVPDWAREISLIASLHCQHWTGYIFNDYDRVLENLKKICTQVEGRRILAYLPGWREDTTGSMGTILRMNGWEERKAFAGSATERRSLA